MANNQQNIVNKRRRWLLIILAVIIVIPILARLSLKTGMVHRLVHSQISKAANELLTANLNIGQVKGDLWKEIKLIDVSITQNDTVLSADALHVRYRLLSYFQPEFRIENVRLIHPFLKVIQDKKGNWNLSEIIKKETSTDTVSADPFKFTIANLNVTHGQVAGTIHSFPEDSVLSVKELNLEAEFRYSGDNFELQLRELVFEVQETQLSSPIRVQTAARANSKRIDLEKLIIATGTSVINSTANIDLNDSTALMNLSARPVSWKDISAYLGKYPLNEDLQLTVGLSGNFTDFEVSLTAEAKSLQQVQLKTGFTWDESLFLRHTELTTQKVDLASLLGDTTLPRFDSLRIEASGNVSIAGFRTADLSGNFLIRQISQNRYNVDEFSGTFTLENHKLVAKALISRQQEALEADIYATEIWADAPSFIVDLEGHQVNPAYWINDTTYTGNLNFTSKIKGKGYQLSDRLWEYQLNIKNSRLANQPFNQATFRGKLNSNIFTTRATIRLKESTLRFNTEVKRYLVDPEYRFSAAVSQFNLAELKGLQDFSTAINANLTGSGRYFEPGRMKLTSMIVVDTSIVNGELIQKISAQLLVSDTLARVDSATVRSAIADGNFSGRFHLLKWYDPENRLDLELKIKDMGSLAPLAGVGQLAAKGDVKGRLNPVGENTLRFNISVDLGDVSYGESFTSEKVEGEIKALITKHPEYELDLKLSNPVIKSVVLQDFSLTTKGTAATDSIFGSFQLTFSSADDSRIQQDGWYSTGKDSTKIHTADLQIVSSERKLQLERPFNIIMAKSAFRVDTLRLVSEDSAYLRMAVPYADSVRQKGYLECHELNMTVIQNTLLNEAYFGGVLFGKISIDRQDAVITSSGDFRINDLVYKDAKLDSLVLKYELQNELLEGHLDAYHETKRLADGQVSVPFKLGNPEKFREAFFEQPVDGYLTIHEVAISRYKKILTDAGIANTEGIFRFTGTLKGKAGQPEINASFTLFDALVSGVALDSVNASVDYAHDKQKLNLNATVISLRQKAAEITSEIPVFVDLKNFDVQIPEENDSIRVEVTTNQFNIASLNDFVSRTDFREIKGTLDGDVVIMGPLKNLETHGEFTFRNGAVRVIDAGIKLDKMESSLAFEKNSIRLKELRAKSGKGNFRAEGKIIFDQLTPTDIDIKMNANNFRVVNTPEYNAVINLDGELAGTFEKPELKGTLDFVSGFMYLQNFGNKSVETVELDTTISADSAGVIYDSLALDMDITFNRRFYVRNSRFLELEYELSGQLDLLKQSGKELQLFGELSAVSGYAQPLGKRFKLENGMIAFSGDPANPVMNIRHLFEPPQPEENVKIWYIIEGNVENPQFKYESEPPMELENIISYTLFGQPFYALESWKQIVATSGSNTGAADVAMDVLLDKVETLATQKLGIDVVQIDNTRTGSSGGTSIKTGWYLNPKVFFAIQNEIAGSNPDTIFILEYLLKKNLKLIITQGSSNQTGVDLRWNYDY